MQEIIPVRIVYHGEFQTERQINIRYSRSDFPNSESLKKYIKNVVINNYPKFTIAKKVEVFIPVNGDEIGNILEAKAKKIEVVEQIVVNVHW